MVIGIVIPTFNRQQTVIAALKSIFEHLSAEHYVIVVDSGSVDGTAEAVSASFPEVELLHGDPSMWWTAATNVGIRRARELGCTHVLTYNDDNIATSALFTALAEAARHHPNSIIGAVCCYLDRPETVFFAGRRRAKRLDRFFILNHNEPLSLLGNGIRPVDLLHGMCTLFPTTVFDTVGLFDEKAFPHLGADDDLTLRAAKAGYQMHVALDAVVLNDRTKTGINPYDRRLGPIGILRLLVSRRSTFQLSGRTRFLWRHRRSTWYFCKTCVHDYTAVIALALAMWFVPTSTLQRLGKRWTERLNRS